MDNDDHPRAAAERRIMERLGRKMLAKLAQRREHGDWKHDGPWSILALLELEVYELSEALHNATVGNGKPEDIIAECADVANYCAMLIDVVSMEGDE